MIKNCLYCGSEFTAIRQHAKYCKPSHKVAYSFALPLVVRLQARITQLESLLEKEKEFSRSVLSELEAGSPQELTYEPMGD